MRHIPVMLDETIQALQLRTGMNVIDCTLGDGGHAEAILEKIGPKGQLLGIDADVESVLRAKRFLYRFGNRFIAARGSFVNLRQIIEKNDFKQISAVLMDLGWSSQQFAERGRGFSFLKDEPLDMRYGAEGRTAAEILNNASERELERIFHLYGEEKFSREIARAIVEARKEKPIEKTSELVEIVMGVYKGKLRGNDRRIWVNGIHPATKVFQALRVAVNNELEALRQALPQAVESLALGGYLAVISFHSLEDRIVKRYFRSINDKLARVITKKPITPSREEIKNNPRARSAKMRIIEKFKLNDLCP